ncbi:stress-activated map kinase-interacting protein 1 [Drosophila biarmipes]|uniref:stress-activated map kinase-interacting protein 1 n=1 Tax=Drosophila biarmipes TaxID=125945 RepID=UPI0007E8A405|nr:stress-activated map kinase-interacting protein 1 [Drosophila biarmipes]
MATYSNQHWLLSHIRNSFISTDDSGMCETVMLSDDMPKHYLRKFGNSGAGGDHYHRRKSNKPPPTGGGQTPERNIRHPDDPLQDVDFICYPGLDLSDDEEDMSTHSFDIQMYPEVGAHRFRSNTAQKLEKLDIAKRRAARIKSINYQEEVQPPDSEDFFKRKEVPPSRTEPVKKPTKSNEDELSDEGVQSQLTEQLAKSPKQTQNRFIEFARFDGTSQVGMQTKRINVYLNMLPEPDRNYPLKICVLATAKIQEVIGYVCYKTSLQYPEVPLKSLQHYALYMTEDNDDMEDFPPLDNREPCSKFGFSHLTLAERRPLAPVTRVDYHGQQATKSMTSEDAVEKQTVGDAICLAMRTTSLNGQTNDPGESGGAGGRDSSHDNVTEYEKRLLNHNDMLEAPMHRTYRVNIIDKRFFKTEVTLGISGERIEIDQCKNAKFWPQKKPVSTPIDCVAYCDIVERRQLKAVLRIWMKSNSSSPSFTTGCTSAPINDSVTTLNMGSSSAGIAHSPNSPGHSSGLFSSSNIRFKHYDFDTDIHIAQQIQNKLNCILEMRCRDLRSEFLLQRGRKLEKRQLKL